jgi:excisionase family DNA binding protein
MTADTRDQRDPNWRKRPTFWTPERIFQLDELIRMGRTDAQIGRAIGCSANAANLARKRRHLPARRAVLLSARAVADRLGIGCAKVVVRWIDLGWLRGRRGQRMGPHRMWYVTEEGLWDFIANPAAWHAWTPERIPEFELRELATAIRAGERYLTPGEVAERFFVSDAAVNDWIHSGTLPAVRHGNWRIKESDLTDFVPPNQRDRHGIRAWRFDGEEDVTILAMRAEGATWQRIADELGRPLGSVYGRHGRLIAKQGTP